MAGNAMRIVNQCANVCAGEDVLIVADFGLVDTARYLARAAYSVGANPTLAIMSVREVDGSEPTDAVAAAMQTAQVILTPVQKSLAHSNATAAALRNGARVLSLTALSCDLLASDAWDVDFDDMAETVATVASILSAGSEVKVQSEAGTDLTFNIAGRLGNAHGCIVREPGQFSAAPNIESSVSPLEGSTNGLLVIDGSIPYLGIGLVDEPVSMWIRHGRVEEVQGGRAALRIKRVWQEQNDSAVYNIAQFALGLNPKIRQVEGSLGCNYDEGAYGTAHVGIGTSSSIGGRVKASTHFDAVMVAPRVVVDGVVLLEEGKFFL